MEWILLIPRYMTGSQLINYFSAAQQQKQWSQIPRDPFVAVSHWQIERKKKEKKSDCLLSTFMEHSETSN